MKKLLSIVMIMVLCLGLMPSTASAAVKINKKSIVLDIGETTTLKITGTKGKVTWTSSKKSVATVSSNGKVTAKKEGQATITATVSGKKYNCKVTVKEKTLDGLVKYLKEEKLIEGSETKMDASMIGGKSGVKYKDSKVELYEFDTSSKEYKSILETNKVTLASFNIELTVSAVNGKFILFCEEAENRDNIIEAFMKY